ncbi:zinc finger protein 93-like [Belonocnema kinseyi]|uniref:zinc finger protein 93-like n=1 Tax=Belonocnema kinseyi TaxID=2817044 RepID=UPI00143D9AEA|nr:zinc finger protein 93-like [Belonocnema kinseyi]
MSTEEYLLSLQREHNYNQREQPSLLFTNNEKNFTCKIEYSDDETLDIKEEIIDDQDTRDPNHGKKYESVFFTVDVKGTDGILEIKEEIIEAEEITGQKHNKKYESKLDAVDGKETYNFAVNKELPPHNSRKIKESKHKPEKKYKCEKCARRYIRNTELTRHLKYECDGRAKFACKFCPKRYKQKSSLTIHIDRSHQNTNSKPLILNYKCEQCPRSYGWLVSLNRHKRLEHAAIKPQFICEYCGHKTNRKDQLLKHIQFHQLKKKRGIHCL